jgi:hypothetical protein
VEVAQTIDIERERSVGEILSVALRMYRNWGHIYLYAKP